MQGMECKGGCLQHLINSMEIYKKNTIMNAKMLVKICFYLGNTYYSKGDMMKALHSYQEAAILVKRMGTHFSGPLGVNILEKVASTFFLSSEYDNALEFFKNVI